MGRPQIEQWALRLHKPKPKGRKMKIRTNLGNSQRVRTIEAAMRASKAREILGNLISTGTWVPQVGQYP